MRTLEKILNSPTERVPDLNHIDINDCNFCSLPSSKESVEWVSMRGLDRGGFVLVKEKKTPLKFITQTAKINLASYTTIRHFTCYTIC